MTITSQDKPRTICYFFTVVSLSPSKTLLATGLPGEVPEDNPFSGASTGRHLLFTQSAGTQKTKVEAS